MSGRSGWQRVRFGDVVRQVKATADPESSGLERYIAGEHMDTDELQITRWGTIGDGYLGPAFHRRFRAGQVLYGSRRTYLRKVALADFEGICANTTFVCETANPGVLLPELLPFVMHSEAFHRHSVTQSKGSVNPYINWPDLAWYEFDLPPIDQQRRITELLSAAEVQRRRYSALVSSSEVAYAAMVDEAFGRLANNDGNRATLKEVTSRIVDGVHKTPRYLDDGVPFITVENLTRGRGIDFSRTRFVSNDDHLEFIKRAHPEFGDVLVSKDGTLGVARVVEDDREFSIFVSVALLKPLRDRLDPWYLRAYFDSSLFKRTLASKTSGSALKHIHLTDFRSAELPVPNLEDQRVLVRRFEQAEAGVTAASDGQRAARALLLALTGEFFG